MDIQTLHTTAVLLEYLYLIAAILFVVGLKKLSHPETARSGNILAGIGMALAMAATIFLHRGPGGDFIPSSNVALILVLIAVSSIAGTIMARKVKMTAMPQFVSLFNATGGAASALVGLLEYPAATGGSALVALLSLAIGSIAFSGSLLAYGKLNGKVSDFFSPVMTWINLLLLLITVVLIAWVTLVTPATDARWVWACVILAVSLVYGVTFVVPIGGADMPVVISLLNSLTGIAAALAGYIYGNQAMVLGGIFVGSAGTILTLLMCKAMNRSLVNVIVGAFGGGGASAGQVAGSIKEITLSDAAVLLSYTQKVVIVPGYGLAVAQAQHTCNELVKMLEDKGVEVKFAIHPVAGRMPGHMNVLLAEADVPYDKLVEMDDINPHLPQTDVVIVIGANDVVNPAAENDHGSPIYGMPIIKAHTARNIIVMKRGMGKGYAAIENVLFYDDKTRMLFGDAKGTLQKLVNEVKNL